MAPDLREEIDRVATESSLSGVVRVWRGDEVLAEGAYGLADRAHGIDATTDTVFAIASGAKTFTALAVMALVGDGQLALDTPVRSLLGDELPLIDAAVTVEHLLTHTSGIGDYLDEDLLDDPDDYVLAVPVHQLATTRDFLAVLDGFPMVAGVGERFAYCNGGFVVLALVVEAASGRSYHDVVTDRILVPAGMTSTGFLRMDQLPGEVAIGYLEDAADDGNWRTNHLHLPVRGAGDGGLFSTLDDVGRFWSALFAGAILPSATVDEMVRAHVDAPAESMRYGLGFWLRPDRDTVQLEGCDAGISFRSAYDRPSGLAYAVIANTTDGAWPTVRLLDDRLPGLADDGPAREEQADAEQAGQTS